MKPVNAANSGQSLGMAKLVLENSPSPLPSAEEASNTENTQENALVKQFSVEGPKECFTPDRVEATEKSEEARKI